MINLVVFAIIVVVVFYLFYLDMKEGLPDYDVDVEIFVDNEWKKAVRRKENTHHRTWVWYSPNQECFWFPEMVNEWRYIEGYDSESVI